MVISPCLYSPVRCPSINILQVSSVSGICIFTMSLSDIIKGRKVRLCGATGVIQRQLFSGVIIGPLHDREYAVEPVGVAVITPSPE